MSSISLCGQSRDLRLWYKTPAENWTDALPLGNGRVGAMVFGGIEQEHLQLNENTLYSGDPTQNFGQVDVGPGFEKVMQLLKDGRNAEADDFIRRHWQGKLHANYQPLGNLTLDIPSSGALETYQRTLDLQRAVHMIRYKRGGVSYTREYFLSHPDSVLVIRLSADKPVLNVAIRLSSVHPTAKASVRNKRLLLYGQAPGYSSRRTLEQIESWQDQYKHPQLFDAQGKRRFQKQTLYGQEADGLGMFFQAGLAIHKTDGLVSESDSMLRISGGKEIILILSAATSFNGFDKSPVKQGLDPVQINTRILRKAGMHAYAALLKRHVADHGRLFGRTDLRLGEHSSVEKPTDERISSFRKDQDPSMVELLFHYGKYLMIAGSRKGGQPLNLQGLWNDLVIPPWNGAYTVNINAEMNYWPAELLGLSDCHEPLFRMVREMAVNGAETARDMYRRRGWVAHHNVSIWRETYPNDNNPGASFWNMTGGWMLSHFWEHYLFTKDTAFLRNDAFPLMIGAARFYSDWLIKDSQGYWVTAANNSPENAFINARGETAHVSSGPTMDLAILRELFQRTIKACRLLKMEAPLADSLQARLDSLAPYKIGAKGQLQEWQTDYAEKEPQHRHVSHLYPLHPGDQIDPIQAPPLAAAARRTLELRGDAATGWSMGWKTNLWARLLDGNHAFLILKNLITPVGFSIAQGDGQQISYTGGGGLYRNMFDAHPPFQIDGNFGVTAGIMEMLLQSHSGAIHLLPALPDAWPVGSFRGLKARGGFEVDVQWDKGRLAEGSLVAHSGGPCLIRTYYPIRIVDDKGHELAADSRRARLPDTFGGKEILEIRFQTIRGGRYKLIGQP